MVHSCWSRTDAATTASTGTLRGTAASVWLRYTLRFRSMGKSLVSHSSSRNFGRNGCGKIVSLRIWISWNSHVFKLLPYQWSHWQRKAQFNAVEVPPRFAIANKLITDFVSPGKVPTICPDSLDSLGCWEGFPVVCSMPWPNPKPEFWNQDKPISQDAVQFVMFVWCLCGSTMRSCVQFVIFVLGAIWKRKFASSTVSCYLGCWSLGLWV